MSDNLLIQALWKVLGRILIFLLDNVPQFIILQRIKKGIQAELSKHWLIIFFLYLCIPLGFRDGKIDFHFRRVCLNGRSGFKLLIGIHFFGEDVSIDFRLVGILEITIDLLIFRHLFEGWLEVIWVLLVLIRVLVVF